MSKIKLTDVLEPNPTKIIGLPYKVGLVLDWCLGVIGGLGIGATVKSCDKEVVKPKECVGCHNRKMAMTIYFKNAGSKTPEEMANAVLATKSPRLLAAVAVAGEKNTPVTARNTGYKKRYHGAFQVNPKYWGAVPYDAIGQAKQAERIPSELTEEMPIKTALSRYGGDTTDAYQKRVLVELVRVP